MQQFSCGHWATDIDDNEDTCGVAVALKAYDVYESGGYLRSIHYSTYCTDCYNYAEMMGHVLHTDEEEIAWLRGEH